MKKLTIAILLVAPVVCGANTVYEHIRNATGKVTFAGTTFLVDPMLAGQGRYPGFEGTFNSELRNPLLPLPEAVEDVLAVGEAVSARPLRHFLCCV